MKRRTRFGSELTKRINDVTRGTRTSGALTQTATVSPGGNSVDNTDIAVTPSGNFLYAANDANSQINCYDTDSPGALTLTAGSPFLVTPSTSVISGLSVDPTGKFLYVPLSNSNSVAAFTIDSVSGALKKVPGSPFATAPIQFIQTYELTISPSGKFLYAFNFNGNTMAAFTIDPTSGALTSVAGSLFAINPNGEGGLVVDPSGQFLYLTIGFGPPNSFDIFNIDPNSGALTANPNSPVAGGEEPLGVAVAVFQ